MNTQAAIEYHNSLLQILSKEDLTTETLEKELSILLKSFCQENRCLETNLTFHSKSKDEPYRFTHGNLNLKEFAYTHREHEELKGCDMEIFHGLIYTTDDRLFEKGSQIRGVIENPGNQLVDKVETLTFIEYPRN